MESHSLGKARRNMEMAKQGKKKQRKGTVLNSVGMEPNSLVKALNCFVTFRHRDALLRKSKAERR